MEKTFDELIADNFRNDSLCVQMKVMAVLQLVREATIAECEKYLDDNVKISNDYIMGKEIKINLPTDRIKINL